MRLLVKSRAVSPEVSAPPVVEDMEVEQETLPSGGVVSDESRVAFEQRFKRPPDVSTEQLEREMNEENGFA